MTSNIDPVQQLLCLSAPHLYRLHSLCVCHNIPKPITGQNQKAVLVCEAYMPHLWFTLDKPAQAQTCRCQHKAVDGGLLLCMSNDVFPFSRSNFPFNETVMLIACSCECLWPAQLSNLIELPQSVNRKSVSITTSAHESMALVRFKP